MTALSGGTGPHRTARQLPAPQPGPGQFVVRAPRGRPHNADAAMLAADLTHGGTDKEEVGTWPRWSARFEVRGGPGR
ncbi:hypothetical protein A6A07_30590 [Streptomyces sp. CB03911]|nr:hypothetical protein A6A07_30590 [Streptomyces sp. CB03911]